MRIKDILFFLNKLNDNGFGDVELYTEWEEDENGYTEKLPEFNLYLNGINEKEILEWWPKNPFPDEIEFNSFGISKECSIHEKDIKLSGCYDVYNKCKKEKEYKDYVNNKMQELHKQVLEYVKYRNEQEWKKIKEQNK